LLREKANIQATNDNNQAPLLLAVEKGHKQVVKLLLDKGADVNAQGREYGNALCVASYGGNAAVVKMLLDKGAYVNALDDVMATHSRRLQLEATRQ
jgi:ankyrin repeat protein